MGDFALQAIEAINWADFWNTFLATVVGAAVALFSSMWLTRRERARPMWRLENVSGHFGELVENYVKADARIVNVGNGDAHNVIVTVVGADQYEPSNTVHLLHPGGKVPAAFCFNISGKVEYIDSETVVDGRVPDPWPKDAYIIIKWQQAPNLRKIRSKKLKIGELPDGWDEKAFWPSDLLSL